MTDVCLLEAHKALASVSKDGSLRLWDLRSQQCVQNSAAPSGELWSVDADAEGTRLITGGANAEVLAWRLEGTSLDDTSTTTAAADGAALQRVAQRAAGAIGPLGVRISTNRVARIRFGLEDSVIAVQFADRHLAVMRYRRRRS